MPRKKKPPPKTKTAAERRGAAPPERLAFARALRRARATAKLSQAALAELCGVSQNYISVLEGGISEPRLETLHRLADALGIGVDNLLPRSERQTVKEDD